MPGRARPADRTRRESEGTEGQAPRKAAARRRDAAATRADLLAAAHLRFTREGYDHTTVRDIAGDVGVNAALIFRYFGSKEELFRAATAIPSIQMTDLRCLPARNVPARLFQRAVETGPSGAESLLTILLRSSTHHGVADQLRQHLADNVVSRLLELVDDPDAELRSDLFVALLVGIGLMRTIIGKKPLADATREELAPYVNAMLSMLIPGSGPV